MTVNKAWTIACSTYDRLTCIYANLVGNFPCGPTGFSALPEDENGAELVRAKVDRCKELAHKIRTYKPAVDMSKEVSELKAIRDEFKINQEK